MVWDKLADTESGKWLFWQEAHLVSSLSGTVTTVPFYWDISASHTANSAADTGINANETPNLFDLKEITGVMNRQKVSPCLQSRVSVGEEGAGGDPAWPGWSWPYAEGGKQWQLCEVARQLLQKGFKQQAMAPTVVSALPEPENRLRGKGKKGVYI